MFISRKKKVICKKCNSLFYYHDEAICPACSYHSDNTMNNSYGNVNVNDINDHINFLEALNTNHNYNEHEEDEFDLSMHELFLQPQKYKDICEEDRSNDDDSNNT